MRMAVDTLPFEHQMAISFRFWENFSILEIAKRLGVTWDRADQLIEEGKDMLSEVCLSHPEFTLHPHSKKNEEQIHMPRGMVAKQVA